MAASETERTSRTVWIALALAAVVLVAAAGLAGALRGDDSSGHSAPASSSSTTPPPATAAAGSPGAVCASVPGTVRMDDMVMAPVPDRAPTASDRAAATALVTSVQRGLTRYAQLSSAIAAGYVPATNPNGYVVHYANWGVVARGDVLDATTPSSLVYANTASGPVLLGAMFMGAGPCRPGPDVGGPLTAWHAHDDLCLSATHEVVARTDAAGACATGRHNTSTYFMLHVWTAPALAGGYQFEAHPPRPVLASIIRSGRG
jgi:hypothetical protein